MNTHMINFLEKKALSGEKTTGRPISTNNISGPDAMSSKEYLYLCQKQHGASLRTRKYEDFMQPHNGNK